MMCHNNYTEVSLDFRDEVCYTRETNTETEHKSDDKDTFLVPRQYLQKPNGRVCNEGSGEKSGTVEPVSYRVRSHQYQVEWELDCFP